MLNSPTGVAVDAKGNVYIADWRNNRVRMVSPAGTISTFAGTGAGGSTGDGGAATSAQVAPDAVAVDGQGNVYVTECGNAKVREVHAGTIKTIAGNGFIGFSGDNGPATSAELHCPGPVAVDGQGNVYIADTYNNRVREVHEGIITTVAGTGSTAFSGDGGPATSAGLVPEAVALDSKGNLYITDYYANRVREVHGGTITTIAGTGTPGSSGDGGPATAANLETPPGVAVDHEGNVYITTDTCRVRKISIDGTITTLAGTTHCGFSGDGCLATLAELGGATPKSGGLWDLALDEQGNIYIADYSDNRVREIRPLAEPEPSCMTPPAEEQKKRQEEAANKKHEEEAAAKKGVLGSKEEAKVAATGSISLDGSTIDVQSGGKAAVKLTCTGTTTCSGKLTLTVKTTTGKGKKKHTKTQTIGTATFSVPAGKSETVKLTLNGTGRAVLNAAHGHLSATLTILKASPAPSNTQTHGVHLAQVKATKAKKR